MDISFETRRQALDQGLACHVLEFQTRRDCRSVEILLYFLPCRLLSPMNKAFPNQTFANEQESFEFAKEQDPAEVAKEQNIVDQHFAIEQDGEPLLVLGSEIVVVVSLGALEEHCAKMETAATHSRLQTVASEYILQVEGYQQKETQ